MDVITLLNSAGPTAAMLGMLWIIFNRLLDAQKTFGEGILAEMKADREALRAEFSEQRDALRDLQTEVGGLREDLRSGGK